MNITDCRSDLPVVILYNMDPSWPADSAQESLALTNLMQDALLEVGHPTTSACVDQDDLSYALEGIQPEEAVVFNWCEELPGIPRSSEQVARQLEMAHFTFTGADSQALEFSQDKRQVKAHLHNMGIPTPRWQIYDRLQPNGWHIFPAIVKPAFEHSSLGITHQSVVRTPGELRLRIEYVLDTFQQPALVEDFIDGREFHVTVLGNGHLTIFPVAEMDFSTIHEDNARLCTYNSKFVPDSLDYQRIELRLPAPLTPEEQHNLDQVAIAAYRACYCRDYARLDIRLRNEVFYVLDVNPNADISPDASVALSAEKIGLSFGRLSSLLINLAALRHPVFGESC